MKIAYIGRTIQKLKLSPAVRSVRIPREWSTLRKTISSLPCTVREAHIIPGTAAGSRKIWWKPRFFIPVCRFLREIPWLSGMQIWLWLQTMETGLSMQLPKLWTWKRRWFVQDAISRGITLRKLLKEWNRSDLWTAGCLAVCVELQISCSKHTVQDDCL